MNAVAFDINAACSGFLFAIDIASVYLRQGIYQKALVVGAETMSRVVDWTDRRTAVLFGDGAGAVVLDASEPDCNGAQRRGILGTVLYTDGTHYHELYTSGGPSTTQSSGVIYMNGREVFRHAVQQLDRLGRLLLEKTGHYVEEVDWFIPHQANKRITDLVAQKLGVPMHKVINSGCDHANTSTASIPLAMWKAVGDGRLVPGHLALLQAFGAGFTGAACLIRL